jgi:hypothetical protein
MNFVYLRSYRLHVFKFEPWFMHWQQGGDRKAEKSCIASLEPIPGVKGELVFFFGIFGIWGCGLLYQVGLTDFGNRPNRFGGTGLTGLGNRLDRFVPSVGTCSGGVCICAGGALVCFDGLCSLLEYSFVSNVSSRCPCLRGPRLVFFKWSCSLPFLGFRSLVGVSFIRFFSLYLLNVCVVNALITWTRRSTAAWLGHSSTWRRRGRTSSSRYVCALVFKRLQGLRIGKRLSAF